MSADVEPAIRELAEQVINGGGSKRAANVLKIMLDKGSINTDEIAELGYTHPPRAIGDVRDCGIPVITGKGVSKSGRQMAVYSLGVAANIQEGRVGGRSALPKKFKVALIQRYGAVDCITGARLDERVLQLDHRIPYRVDGDVGLSDHDVEAYMLLDASSQRAKSWSCENCPNMDPAARVPMVCRRCFWAFPEDYDHIATEQLRRTDVSWQGADIAIHDHLRDIARDEGVSVAELLRQLARAKASDG
ncbi:MAG TPA: hypothetical protein VL460_10195 [Caulobacteraceae bacterium]|jgi:hypothetical protein|nr:hypothetical protein [Caulobacteraceae bacterium]